MAVAFLSGAGGQTNSDTSVTASFTVDAAANFAMWASDVVAISPTVTSGTYNGVALNLVAAAPQRLKLWSLVAPAVGANTLSFALSGFGQASFAGASYSGVDTTTPYGTPVQATGTSAAPSTGSVTAPAGGSIFGAASNFYTGSGNPTAGAGTTLIYSVRSGATGYAFAAGRRDTTGAVSFVAPGSSAWEAIGVPINASGGADTTPPTITGPGSQSGSTAAVNHAENGTTVGTWAANESVTWSLNGGADAAFFSIGAGTGILSFLSAPNFESPADAGANNTYVVVVRATDAATNATDQTVTVTVVNANEAPAFAGPSIATINLTQGVAMTPTSYAGRFSDPDSGDAGTYSQGGTWPAGVSLSSAGVMSGTPTTPGTYAGLTIIRTDGNSLTATSNSFSIVVAAAPVTYTATLEPVAVNIGSGPRLNATFAFSAWKDGVIGNMDGLALHEGAGITNGTTGAATITTFPSAGTWRVERVFLDGADCVENVTAA